MTDHATGHGYRDQTAESLEKALLDLRAELLSRVDAVLARVDPAKYGPRMSGNGNGRLLDRERSRSALFSDMDET